MLHVLSLPFPKQKGTLGGLAELPWETPQDLRRTSALWLSIGMHERIILYNMWHFRVVWDSVVNVFLNNSCTIKFLKLSPTIMNYLSNHAHSASTSSTAFQACCLDLSAVTFSYLYYAAEAQASTHSSVEVEEVSRAPWNILEGYNSFACNILVLRVLGLAQTWLFSSKASEISEALAKKMWSLNLIQWQARSTSVVSNLHILHLQSLWYNSEDPLTHHIYITCKPRLLW